MVSKPKIEPCVLCGKKPAHGIDTVSCKTPDCLCCGWLEPTTWNNLMRSARRRIAKEKAWDELEKWVFNARLPRTGGNLVVIRKMRELKASLSAPQGEKEPKP